MQILKFICPNSDMQLSKFSLTCTVESCKWFGFWLPLLSNSVQIYLSYFEAYLNFSNIWMYLSSFCNVFVQIFIDLHSEELQMVWILVAVAFQRVNNKVTVGRDASKHMGTLFFLQKVLFGILKDILPKSSFSDFMISISMAPDPWLSLVLKASK